MNTTRRTGATVEMIGVDWPAVRAAMRYLGLSSAYVGRLIHQQRIRAVKTRLGYLLDPVSLAAFEAERARHPPTTRPTRQQTNG